MDSPEIDGVPINGNTADLAELILDMTRATDAVTRDDLRREWLQLASDLRRIRPGSEAQAERRDDPRGQNRGLAASHVLKNCLRRLEQAGAAQRVGEHAVVVLDRARLRSIVDLWDTEPPDVTRN